MDEKKIHEQEQPKKIHGLRFLTMLMALASVLSMSAFAADGDPVTVSGLMSDATPTITSAMTSVWSIITGNPLMTFALGCAILSIGFRFFRKALRTSHRA